MKIPSPPSPEQISASVTVEVIKGIEGFCLAVNDKRVAGPKPWAGGKVTHKFVVDSTLLLSVIQGQERHPVTEPHL